MYYAFLRSHVVPIGQVSPNCPPAPLLLLHPTMHPSPLPPFASPLYSHHSVTKYIHFLPFYTFPDPQFHSSLPCSPSLHFRFYLHYLWMSPCCQHLSPPLPIILDCFSTLPIPCMTHPTLLLLPAHPALIFAFLKSFMAVLLLPAPPPTTSHHILMFFNPPHPLDDPPIPPAPAPACSPASIFAF